MYGLQGGFGMMPYQSPGSSLLAGFTAGTAYLQRQQEEKDRQDHMALERDREDRIERMQQAHITWMERNTEDRDARERNKEMLEGLKMHGQMLDGQGQALLETYGNDWKNVPPDVRNAHAARIADFNNSFDGAMQSVYGAKFKEWMDQGQSHLKDFASGTLDPTNPDHGQQLCHSIVCTGQDPRNLLKSGDEPSAVEQHLANFHDG